ncbi:Ig-like domain-containing protein [Natronobiforma cellulositropha]|uniref:Ig-like domain-containing protein n=1 Tax=Natronobiforma cellulositropha TaxID=1679076 RepID=UPI0021D585CD|nr:CARDB domain-containing protein [Natronobiforma cellulositropha]
MSRPGDERAVTVQIGAVLLLAILIATLSLYQVNAVPDQTFDAEFTHHQGTLGDLVELRDAIGDFDARHERGVPVSLGTQYQTRVVAINPPAPAGEIATSEPKAVRVENASVDDPTVADILENPPTTRLLAYEPGYNEYDAPTTVLEHGLLYNRFDGASVTLEEQTAIGEERITLVFVDGNLSRAASGTVSVAVETIGGPSDERRLESDGTGNVTITLPTRAEARWEASVGTTFDAGVANARILPDGDEGTVTVELADESYALQVAQVRVGEGGERDERFDEARAGEGGGGETGGDGGSGPFAVSWASEEVTVVEGESETLEALVTDAETGEPVAAAGVDFSRSGAAISFEGDSSAETDEDGVASVTVTGESEGESAVFATVSGGHARAGVTVEAFEPPTDEPYVDVAITGTNAPVEAGSVLTVDATVENRGEAGSQTVTLETDDGTVRDSQTVTLDGGEVRAVTLEWATEASDARDEEYTVTVRSENTQDSRAVRVDASAIEDGSVFAVAAAELENNQQIDTTVTLETDEGSHEIRVLLVDQPGGGAAGSDGSGWQTKRVFVDGTVLELETAAADDIAVNLAARDLLDEDTYVGGDTSMLEGIREAVDGSSELHEQTDEGSVGLTVTIEERSGA